MNTVKTKPQVVKTLIDLVSKKMQWDDSLQCPVRDSRSFEIVSSRLLNTLEVNAIVNQRYPGYLVVGVYDCSDEPEEF